MNTSDILFAFPPSPGNSGAFKNHLGVAYLRAALAQRGISSTQYVNQNPGTVDSVAAEMIGHKSPVIGFTVYDSNAALSIALAQSIKRQNPDVQVVIGGPASTFGASRLLARHPTIDLCVLGEAEETAAHIFTTLLDRHEFDNKQPGVAFRRDEEIVCTALAPLVGSEQPSSQAQLDVTPSPYLSGILADGRTGVLTGRGCTHTCQYCCFAALARKRFRLHSTERVVGELEYIAEQQKRTGQHYVVAVQDDTFTLLPKRAKALCQAIIDRKLDLRLSCITRADAIDEELIRLMREAGFVSLAFGLESAVPSVLRAIGKVRPPDWHDPDLEPEQCFVQQVRTSVRMAKKHGFYVGVSIILGLPTETAANGAETLAFVNSLPIDYYMHNYLSVFPGTPLWDTHDRYGIGCTLDALGLPLTTVYPYDVTSLKPRPKCESKRLAKLTRLVALDVLYGCHARAISTTGTGTAVIHGRTLSTETAQWLRSVLNVGGVVLQVYPEPASTELPLRFFRDRCVLSDNLVPARFHIHVHPQKSNDHDESWRAVSTGVDVYGVHYPSVLSFRASDTAQPFIAWANHRYRIGATACDISQYLHYPRELTSLADQIEGQDMPSPFQSMPVPPQIKYSGRWLTGELPCLSLTRLEVDDAGKVRCCQHGEAIGEVGEPRQALCQRLKAFVSAAERRRGCAQCPVTNCPRCPFPGVDDDTYCRVMSGNSIQSVLQGLVLYSRLPLLLALEQDKVANE